MTLRIKITLMLSVFFVIIAILAAGTLLIFDTLGLHMASLGTLSEETKMLNEMDRNIADYVEVVREWGLTRDLKYKKLYGKKLTAVYKSFSDLGMRAQHQEELRIIAGKFQDIQDISRTILGRSETLGTQELLERIRSMEALALEIITRIDGIQEISLATVSKVAQSAEKTKRRMIQYHSSLIAFTLLIAVLLFFSIRRTITEPFNELLKATGRIGRGDLAYRIGMARTDEFGIVAQRFDDMVGELEFSSRKLKQRLTETELLLDIAKVAGMTLNRRDAFVYIIETIAGKMQYGSCSIYMLDDEKKTFSLEATNDPQDKHGGQSFPIERAMADRLCGTLESLQGAEFREVARYLQLEIREHESGIAVPIIRNSSCIGMLIIRNRDTYEFSDDETNILKIISHTVGSVIRNAELYQAARQQAEKMTVLFDLSRAVTSLLDLDALLRKITEEVSRLIAARGCIIRLLEENTLKIRSSYGLSRELEQSLDLAVGEGIAGWVAEHGEPMLVEDSDKISVNLKQPGLDIRTAICVPLKVGETVIGTLSLYDKYDSQGALVPFTADDLGAAEGFASISSIAIDKARIYANEINRQQKALEERKRLNILFDSVQGGIITLDRNFVVTSANRYIEDWTGLPGSELVGRDSQDIFHDKIGICPHCASKTTFETGDINTITQSRGVNYAELTAYPIRNEAGEVVECVVFIMDITERILYQEETLSLYREVIQTKEYLESIIGNSADAIVTSDLDGLVTSWNQGAERIFGYEESEVIGKFIPFVPEAIMDSEHENIERLKQGEVLKDVETLRRRKDGIIIEVSLTLSPIKDAAGEVIGICGISRDISEKKRVEKELIQRNDELSRLFFISSAMRSTLDLDRLLRMVLTAVTMSEGLGFNRAILFLVDEERKTLKGVMGVGPASPEEAWQVWDDLSMRRKTLDDIMNEILAGPHQESFLEGLARHIELPLADDTVLTRAIKTKESFNVLDVQTEPLADPVLIQQLGTQAYAVVPLISRGKVIGLIWVDNYFNRKVVSDSDMRFLAGFSNQIASAIESARLFEQMTMAEQQLENIFESMSDMVYFNSSDYVVQRINQAVIKRLGLPEAQILGRKCYELFHGTTGPYVKCPHHKTVTTKQAYIEELDDPHLGGTFLTSSSPIFDTAGEFIGSVHVVRDITELKQLQKKLVTSEKMAALGEVAARVAHEIRNPLVSVGGFAKRLEKKLDGNLQEYAGIIVKEVSRLEGILREILGFVKEVRLSREAVNLNPLVEDILRLMESGMEERGIRLTREYEKDMPEVFIDPNRVKEALMNIITNAVQALSGSGSINVRTFVREREAVFEVMDTGKGIPAEEISSIFNPFFTTKATGTGLGLAITHRIIQEHGGRIEVDSTPGSGTTFRVFLPIKEGAS